MPNRINDSTLQRYFCRPHQYQDFDYLSYYEHVCLYAKLPRSVQEENAAMDSATPQRFVVERNEPDRVVYRIRSVSPANVELFALRLLLMNRPFKSFSDAKDVGSRSYSTYRDAAAARGLFISGDEYERAFDEARENHCTPGEM